MEAPLAVDVRSQGFAQMVERDLAKRQQDEEQLEDDIRKAVLILGSKDRPSKKQKREAPLKQLLQDIWRTASKAASDIDAWRVNQKFNVEDTVREMEENVNIETRAGIVGAAGDAAEHLREVTNIFDAKIDELSKTLAERAGAGRRRHQ